MSRNGSGTYSLPAGNPVVTGAVISSTTHNSTLSDIATALTDSLAKDGQTTPTANLPMGTYKHTGVGAATATTDYARADQVQNSSMEYLASVAGTDTITATATPTPAAYAAGQTFRFVPANNNTGAATINISGLGAKSITKNGTTALAAADLTANKVAEITYDGTQFQLANPAGGSGTVTAVSVASANGFAGSSSGGDTPALTLTTSITGMLKGNGTAISAGAAATDYVAPGTTTTSGLTMTTARLLGRTTASTGAIEEITVGSGLSLSAGALTATGSGGITLGTYTASTSGTSIDFTGIPSTAQRIKVMLNGVSTNGTSVPIVQIGPSGGVETSGYTSTWSGNNNGGAVSIRTSTAGMIFAPASASSDTVTGAMILDLMDASTNTWVSTMLEAGPFNSTTSVGYSASVKAMAGAISKLRLTMTNGTDTFDAGNVNISYE